MTQESFRKYYEKLYLPLCMYALRLTGDTQEADDAVQEAFTTAWRLLADSDEPAYFRAYMYQAVRNQSLMLLRHKKHRGDMPREAENITEEIMDTSERDAAVWKAIGKLPPKCHEVFLASKRDGLTYSEIAAEYGISVKTVENQISKALKQLRSTLQAHPGKIFFLPFL